MGDEDARTILQGKHALGSGDIFLKGRLRFLHDADVEAVLDQDVVNALPAGTVCPGA
jgi:hypothetical protein